MNILITGANGQLGLALREELKQHEIMGVDLPGHDIAERKLGERFAAGLADGFVAAVDLFEQHAHRAGDVAIA